MSFEERALWILVGCALGYLIRLLQEMRNDQREMREALKEVKEELDEVDEIVKTNNPPCHMKRDESGLVRRPLLLDAVLFIVVVVTFYAAWQTGKVNDEVAETQERVAGVTLCNQRYLAITIDALNERTAFTSAQAEANIALQREQSRFLAILLLVPPAPESRQVESLEEYFDSLTEFVSVSKQLKNTQQDNPFPTEDAFASCLDGNEEALAND